MYSHISLNASSGLLLEYRIEFFIALHVKPSLMKTLHLTYYTCANWHDHSLLAPNTEKMILYVVCSYSCICNNLTYFQRDRENITVWCNLCSKKCIQLQYIHCKKAPAASNIKIITLWCLTAENLNISDPNLGTTKLQILKLRFINN